MPLNGLRVFDAAARHLSFTRAADELAVTPAAVGQQIRALEDMLGVVLFRRTPRGLELTPEAEAGLPALRNAFLELEESVRAMQAGQSSQHLTDRRAARFHREVAQCAACRPCEGRGRAAVPAGRVGRAAWISPRPISISPFGWPRGRASMRA